MTIPFHRKIGGIHWFALGRVRISVCWVKYPGVSRKMARDFSAADARFRADWPAGEARTRAPRARMPKGEAMRWPIKPFYCVGSNDYGAPICAFCKRNGGICQWAIDIEHGIKLKPRLPHTTAFPWPPETKQ